MKPRLSALSNFFYTRWWLLFFPLLLALIIGILIIFLYPSIYEAKATFAIRPRSNLSYSEEFVRALDTLIGRVEINATFAEIAESNLIRNRSIQSVNINNSDQQYYSATANVIIGTNLLEIVARGNNPAFVRDFADTVGAETVAYIRNIYDVFELEPLDQARLPGSPINMPSWQILTLTIFIGLMLSGSLIKFVRYYHFRRDEFPQVNISDQETGAFNQSYFLMRLKEEVVRTRKLNNSLAILLIRFSFRDLPLDEYQFEDWGEDMRIINQHIKPYLKGEDILARFDENTFSLLLLDLSEEEYHQKVKELRNEVRSLKPEYVFEGRLIRAGASMGVVFYQSNDLVTDDIEIQDFAAFALKNAGKTSTAGFTESIINSQGELIESESEL